MQGRGTVSLSEPSQSANGQMLTSHCAVSFHGYFAPVFCLVFLNLDLNSLATQHFIKHRKIRGYSKNKFLISKSSI